MNEHGEYNELNQRLDFIMKANPRTFLFIRVSTTDTYKYVITELRKFADLAVVRLSEEDDILQKVKSISNNVILLDVKPTQSSLLKRLDYLRDSLHSLRKLLIFIFFPEHYSKVVRDYPDFYAYSTATLDYATKLPVPFTLIFSNHLISNDKKNIFSSSTYQRVDDMNVISFILYGTDKLKHTKMNAVELQKLNNVLHTALIVARYLNDEDKKIIIYSVLQCLEVLSSKELFDFIEENLIELYTCITKLDMPIDLEIIYYFCADYFTEKKINSFFRDVMNSTIKILIPYYSYSNNEGDLKKALKLSTVQVNYMNKGGQFGEQVFSDDLLAESYNDLLILEYMTMGDAEECLLRIECLQHLKLNYENAFLYYHNKAVLLLLSEKYEDTLALCEDFMESYKHFQGSGMAYYRIQLIRNWVRGVYDRHLQESIDSNIGILKNHRSVFSENHYSIAEIHFCNAYMFYELKDLERSRHCVKKAQNILNQNHSARLKRLKELVNEFANKLE